jgi:hypothetical protein
MRGPRGSPFLSNHWQAKEPKANARSASVLTRPPCGVRTRVERHSTGPVVVPTMPFTMIIIGNGGRIKTTLHFALPGSGSRGPRLNAPFFMTTKDQGREAGANAPRKATLLTVSLPSSPAATVFFRPQNYAAPLASTTVLRVPPYLAPQISPSRRPELP